MGKVLAMHVVQALKNLIRYVLGVGLRERRVPGYILLEVSQGEVLHRNKDAVVGVIPSKQLNKAFRVLSSAGALC